MFIKRGTSMCPLFNILDHMKTRTHCVVPNACWEETGLLTRNRAIPFSGVLPCHIQYGRQFWNKHLFEILLAQKVPDSEKWTLAKQIPFCSVEWRCKSHSEAPPEGSNSFKSIQAALALPWFKAGKAISGHDRYMCEFCMWQLHMYF